MTETVIITISNIGEVNIDVDGVQGTSCEKITEVLEMTLAGERVKKKKKPEYYLPEGLNQKITQQL